MYLAILNIILDNLAYCKNDPQNENKDLQQ